MYMYKKNDACCYSEVDRERERDRERGIRVSIFKKYWHVAPVREKNLPAVT